MGDKTHIVELIDQMLDETSEQPQLQEKVLDLRDALFQAQQMAEQYSLKIKTLEEAIEKLKSPAHRIGTVLGQGESLSSKATNMTRHFLTNAASLSTTCLRLR